MPDAVLSPIGAVPASSRGWNCVPWAVFSFAGFGVALQSAAGMPPAAQHVPASAAIYLSIPNARQFESAVRRTQFGQLYQSPALAAFHQAVSGSPQAPGTARASLPALGLTWEDIVDVAGGEVCLAMAPVPDRRGGFLLLIDTGDKPEAARALLQRLAATHAQFGLRQSQQQLANQPVVAYTLPGGTPPYNARYYLARDGVLGVSDRVELLAEILRLWDTRGAGALSQNAAFHAVMTRSDAGAGDLPADARWYLDPFGLEEMLHERGGGGPDTSLELIKNQGFAAVQALGGSVVFDRHGNDVAYSTAVYAPEKLVKGSRLLHGRPLARFDLPPWASGKVDGVSAFGWDFSEALAGYGSWFDASYAEGEEGVFETILEDMRDESDGPQVDVRKELVAQLEGPVWCLTATVSADGTPRSRGAYAIRVRDEKVVSEAVRKMLQHDPDVEAIRIGQDAAWRFRDLNQAAAAGTRTSAETAALGPDLSNVAISVARGYLLVTNDAALLSQLLNEVDASRPPPPELPVVAHSQIRQLLSQKKQVTGWYEYRLSDTLRAPYELIRSGQRPQWQGWFNAVLARVRRLGAASPATGASSSGEAWAPLSRLPPFDDVRTFLGSAAGYTQQVSDGWLLVGFVLPAGNAPAPPR